MLNPKVSHFLSILYSWLRRYCCDLHVKLECFLMISSGNIYWLCSNQMSFTQVLQAQALGRSWFVKWDSNSAGFRLNQVQRYPALLTESASGNTEKSTFSCTLLQKNENYHNLSKQQKDRNVIYSNLIFKPINFTEGVLKLVIQILFYFTLSVYHSEH